MSPWFDGYPLRPDSFDEVFFADGTLRPAAAGVLEALGQLDPGELHELLGELVGVQRVERVLVLHLGDQQLQERVLAERVGVQGLAHAAHPLALLGVDAAGGIQPHAHHEATALQLDFQPREHKLGLALLALAAVEDLHLIVHGVHLVQQPVLNVVVPQCVGAFHGGIQVLAGSHAHGHAEGVHRDRKSVV